MRLFGTISEDPALNTEIESRLLNFEPTMRTILLDALEVLKNAGEAGYNQEDWHTALQEMDPTTSERDIVFAINASIRSFDCCVRSLSVRPVYVWYESLAGVAVEDDGSMSNEEKNAIGTQVALAHRLMSIAQKLKTFTRNQLAAAGQQAGLSRMMIDAYIDHFIQQFAGTVFKQNADGSYTVTGIAAPQSSDAGAERHLSIWRDMAARAGDLPPMEESAKTAKKNVEKKPRKSAISSCDLPKQEPTKFPKPDTKAKMIVSKPATKESRAPSMRDMMNQLNEENSPQHKLNESVLPSGWKEVSHKDGMIIASEMNIGHPDNTLSEKNCYAEKTFVFSENGENKVLAVIISNIGKNDTIHSTLSKNVMLDWNTKNNGRNKKYAGVVQELTQSLGAKVAF
jgi:hypothetical protein